MDLRFYHLTKTSLEKTLPKLLTLTLQRGHRAVVRFGSEQRARWYEDFLWTFDDREFLPHALAGKNDDAEQPVLLTHEHAVAHNKARYIFWADGFNPLGGLDAVDGGSDIWPLDDQAERLSVLFVGQDEDQLALARKLYRFGLDAEGVDPSYWQESETGAWSQAA